MVVNSLYYNSPQPFKAEKTSISISDEVLTAALQAIYARDFNPQSTIEPNLFTAISATLRSAISAPVPGDSSPGLDPILSALRHSADVFAAFKVHRAQNDMAARLLDSNGNLKPFEQWKAEVLPIASHQCGPWLETEYNTAVLRARQTAQWQQFLAEKDVLPNLKWLPSTSPNPGADHRLYWNTILPIDHPFWDQHRPGDRWNCKCSLTSTDEPPTPVPGDSAPVPGDLSSGNTPHPGLAGNPAKTRALFSQDHPYFPKDCNHCAFYKPNVKSRLRSLFKAQTKDCYHCPYINGCIDRKSAIQSINIATRKRKKEALEHNLMPAMPDRNFANLETGTIHLTGKVRDRLFKHLHHDYDVDAAIYMWNHIEELEFVTPSELGENKDMTIQKNIDNIYRKEKRGVVKYLIYTLTYEGRTFIVKTEKLKYGNEQPYSLYEE